MFEMHMKDKNDEGDLCMHVSHVLYMTENPEAKDATKGRS
jgi:hypothetical protein